MCNLDQFPKIQWELSTISEFTSLLQCSYVYVNAVLFIILALPEQGQQLMEYRHTFDSDIPNVDCAMGMYTSKCDWMFHYYKYWL